MIFGLNQYIGMKPKITQRPGEKPSIIHFRGKEYPPNMSQQLLLAACEQAERSETAVQAAALMHIARVLARSDESSAVALLKRGLTLAKNLDAETAQLLLNNAVFLAAAVSPGDAFHLYGDQKDEREKGFGRHGSSIVGLANAMAQHGHIGDLLGYFDDRPGERFPLFFVGNLSRECPDDETRLKLLRLSAQAFRTQEPDDFHPHERQAFGGIFARYWHLLPAGEARTLLLEIVDAVLTPEAESPRFPLTGDPGEPKLTQQEHLMFGLLPAIHSLEPDLSQGLFQKRPQLAKAAERHPRGMQSIWDSQPKFDRARDDSMTVGDSSIMPMPKAIATDFKVPFREAAKLYAKDSNPTNPNTAPKDCWPSAREFRNILFKAGQHLGYGAEKYLDRISDPDLRLFAQIELCAGAEDLPQLGCFSAFRPSKAPPQRRLSAAELEKVFGPELPGIRCPKCQWKPRAKVLWSCKCAHRWNTFDTRGLCPGCGYQWEVTGCLQCGAMSSHLEWYVEN
jgi:hypothetical protein